MALIYAGIDEAGYGPLLGPLCVGLCVLRVEEWTEGEAAPDVWKLLKGAVCRDPGDRRRRVAVDDSKKLKLANAGKKHPLVHLERGVLSFLLCKMHEEALARGEAGVDLPPDDEAFFRAIGVKIPGEEWYAERLKCDSFPVGAGRDEVSIARSVLAREVEAKGVCVRELCCEVMGESDFNEVVTAAGNKSAATEAALVGHLWTIWEKWAVRAGEDCGGVRVVCDRQGGRANYVPVLERAFPGVKVVETHQSATQSRYELTGVGRDGRERHMHVLFLVESEREHLPVALASMVAKLTRETLMARFNRYWQERLPELKPTAGYRNDAWRWLEEASGVFREGERAALIRRA